MGWLRWRTKLKIARLIKGLFPSIANKVDLEPYLSFDDVCHLVVKVEKQLKGQKTFQTASSIHPSSTPKGYSMLNKAITAPTAVKTLKKR